MALLISKPGLLFRELLHIDACRQNFPSLYKEASAAEWDFVSACSEIFTTKSHVLCSSMHRGSCVGCCNPEAAAIQRLLALSVLSMCASTRSSGFQETKDHPWLCLASS